MVEGAFIMWNADGGVAWRAFDNGKVADSFIKARYSRIPRNSSIELENHFGFVKIIYKENSNFDLALRKRLFCTAKPTLLPCKRAAFGMQNNRFYKALIYRLLCDSCACEKCLHF